MYKFGFFLSVLVGAILYGHVTSSMGLSHETGMAAGLVVAILSLAVNYLWISGQGSSITRGDRWQYKHKAHKRSRYGRK